MIIRVALAILLTIPFLSSGAAPKWKRVLPQTPPDVTLHTNLVCATYGERKVTVDLYVPDAPGKRPGILFIHGGGWNKGSIETDKPLAERLAARGYVCALADYRLSGEAKYPAALHDAKAALRWMRANAAKYRIDTNHLGVIGGSAGGHLSGLLAMTNDRPEFEGDGGHATFSSRVQACIVMAATMDLQAANLQKTSTNAVLFFGAACSESPELYRKVSPITHVRAGSPPTLFIEGEKDTVKIGRAEMQEKLRALKIDTGLFTLKDGPHPFWMSQPWLDETAAHALAFFDCHLKRKIKNHAQRAWFCPRPPVRGQGPAPKEGWAKHVVSSLCVYWPKRSSSWRRSCRSWYFTYLRIFSSSKPTVPTQ